MKKYKCYFTVDASITVEVEAKNEEEAAEKAWELAGRPQLCHHCTREVEIGDVLDLVEVAED